MISSRASLDSKVSRPCEDTIPSVPQSSLLMAIRCAGPISACPKHPVSYPSDVDHSLVNPVGQGLSVALPVHLPDLRTRLPSASKGQLSGCQVICALFDLTRSSSWCHGAGTTSRYAESGKHNLICICSRDKFHACTWQSWLSHATAKAPRGAIFYEHHSRSHVGT
ncbi:hypothetical protein BC827DRAFT_629060 [Russula dissimulans]|nr:hypothetical protein BC827DRAFT_629060 [Russula dissimulans]